MRNHPLRAFLGCILSNLQCIDLLVLPLQYNILSRLLVKAVFPPKKEPSLFSLIRLSTNRKLLINKTPIYSYG